jgi:hypothetical protein
MIQFLKGEASADDLAGFFGENGVNSFAVFIILVLSLEAGNWIVREKAVSLFSLFCLGGLASAVGEMKIFFVMAVWFSFITLIIFALWRRRILTALLYGSIFSGGLCLFIFMYDKIVPITGKLPAVSYLHWEYLNEYLTMVFPSPGENYYYVGRLADLQIAWKQVSKGVFDLLLGFGMGSRSQSMALGSSGSLLTSLSLGLYVGTSLATFLVEYGVVGITLLSVFLIWLFSKLLRVKELTKEQQSLGIGLAIFTSCLPFWFFYHNYSYQFLSNLLYWIGVGYLLKKKKDAGFSTQIG